MSTFSFDGDGEPDSFSLAKLQSVVNLYFLTSWRNWLKEVIIRYMMSCDRMAPLSMLSFEWPLLRFQRTSSSQRQLQIHVMSFVLAFKTLRSFERSRRAR
ncbi:uncharacterized protein BJ212DRAFT_1380316 [Suillus subaureus]|uniref:Uncharacterized protein n=1 Tax=Suillus subaureus TaxID=48587 RepID=A0A9P7E2A5_9AGAM|nr:uncharacterized protein BJ212DRAFT_1380316 [Suillus subaureus]KAG1809101.1 hypothetical protein BJ212DRAFT_1380316 [Suillus subaureus]